MQFSCLVNPDQSITQPSSCVAQLNPDLGNGYLTAVKEFVLYGSSSLSVSNSPYLPSKIFEGMNAPCDVPVEPGAEPTFVDFNPDPTSSASIFTVCYHNEYDQLPCAPPVTQAPSWPMLDFFYTWYYWLPALSVVLFVILCTLTGIRRRRAMLQRLRAQRQRLLAANDAIDSAEVTVSYVAPQEAYPTPALHSDAKPEMATATYAVISSENPASPLPVASPVNDLDSALLDN